MAQTDPSHLRMLHGTVRTSQVDAAEPSYGEVLERAMERQGLSVTELARRLSAISGNRMESERANLRTYLHRGHTPNKVKAGQLAEVLGEPALTGLRPRDRELAGLRRQVAELRDALRRAGLLPPEEDGGPRPLENGQPPR